jgi:tRNA 2-thiouridine synthesizing protein D
MARRGHNINVFAFEGASGLAFSKQAPHPNPVHGKNVAEENHPTTKDQVTALLALAAKSGGKVDWVNCGMCVDERGLGEFVADTRRGCSSGSSRLARRVPSILLLRATSANRADRRSAVFCRGGDRNADPVSRLTFSPLRHSHSAEEIRRIFARGTDGSNPVPSSSESGANSIPGSWLAPTGSGPKRMCGFST